MRSEEIRERLKQLETSCLCDAKKTLRCLDSAIRPLSLGVQLVGRAFTVSCCNDFLTVIKALQDASPGDVLVVDGQEGRTALAGELFSTEAKRKGLAGMVVDGAVRDVATIRAMQFPVYCRAIFPMSGSGRVEQRCGEFHDLKTGSCISSLRLIWLALSRAVRMTSAGGA